MKPVIKVLFPWKNGKENKEREKWAFPLKKVGYGKKLEENSCPLKIDPANLSEHYQFRHMSPHTLGLCPPLWAFLLHLQSLPLEEDSHTHIQTHLEE